MMQTSEALELLIGAPQNALESRALIAPADAQALAITDQRSFEAAAEFVKGLVTLRNEIIEDFADSKKKAWDAHRAICAQEAKHLAPVADAERIVKSKLSAWQQEQLRIQAEAAHQARIEANRRAEEERLAAAVEAEEQGASEVEVQAVLEMPVVVPLVRPMPSQPKVQGVSMVDTYGAEVTDVKALCKSIAEGITPVHFVSPNMTAINQQARAMRESFNVPGCRVVKSTNTRVSTGRR